ncbi:hypothetical protein ACQWU4_04815 [Chryseobacterium sp. MIQD13]|uniref:hypothetical protein n=1 Tax=Chryseobacterium sp. MIQD13 TaxID=3422310 RepID=UPI003D287755
MKSLRFNNFNFYFLNSLRTGCLLLLSMSVSIKTNAQIYISDNTVFTVDKNSTVYISENSSDNIVSKKTKEAKKVLIYAREGGRLINFPSDSLDKTVYLEKEQSPENLTQQIVQKKKEKKTKNRSTLTSRNKNDIREKEDINVFTSGQNNPFSIFSSNKKIDAISVSAGYFFKPLLTRSEKHKDNYIFLLDLKEQATTAFEDNSKKLQFFLQNYISRPPPLGISGLS